mmetsp:Transcript_3554/g.10365  ORF Transcript_3554/g.10365 Transcript_3554/m.10365 type:complete len:231 (-) Transcript_3554:119-811(-)
MEGGRRTLQWLAEHGRDASSVVLPDVWPVLLALPRGQDALRARVDGAQLLAAGAYICGVAVEVLKAMPELRGKSRQAIVLAAHKRSLVPAVAPALSACRDAQRVCLEDAGAVRRHFEALHGLGTWEAECHVLGADAVAECSEEGRLEGGAAFGEVKPKIACRGRSLTGGGALDSRRHAHVASLARSPACSRGVQISVNVCSLQSRRESKCRLVHDDPGGRAGSSDPWWNQ